MYCTYSDPTRILPGHVIDKLRELEGELERPFLLAYLPGSGYDGCVTNYLSTFWSDAATHAGEPIPDDVKERALLILVGGSETGAVWDYFPEFPQDAFLLGQVPEVRTLPGSEYPVIRDGGLYETFGLNGLPRFVEYSDKFVCFMLPYSRGWSTDLQQNLDWDKLLIDHVRTACSQEFAANMEQRQQQRMREQFENFMRESRESALTNARNRLNSVERTIYELTEQLSGYMRQGREIGAEIAGIAARVNEGGEEDYQAMWDAIVNHPRISNTRLTGGLFSFQTDDMFMTHPVSGERRWLGRFSIMINLRSPGSIRMTNIDNSKGGRDHPHISNGTPCWGSIHPTIAQLCSQMQLYALVDVLIMFLETFNLDDEWGMYASYWFDVPDETPERLGGEGRELQQPAYDPVEDEPLTDDIFEDDYEMV